MTGYSIEEIKTEPHSGKAEDEENSPQEEMVFRRYQPQRYLDQVYLASRTVRATCPVTFVQTTPASYWC